MKLEEKKEFFYYQKKNSNEIKKRLNKSPFSENKPDTWKTNLIFNEQVYIINKKILFKVFIIIFFR